MTENEPQTIVDRRGRVWQKALYAYPDGLTRYATSGEHYTATAHEIKTGRVGNIAAYREALEAHRKNAR